MNFPLQITFREIAESDFVYNDVWDHAEKLERFYDRIMSCHVLICAPHQHHHHGKIYHVQIRMHLPGGDIFVTTDPEINRAHEDVYVAVRDAFDAVRRRLEEFVHRERGLVKDRSVPEHGKVTRIFPNEGCGFISTPNQREIYFHEHSVLNAEFRTLKIGDEVRFSEEMGEKGPQVTSMQRVGHSGHIEAIQGEV